MKITSEKFLLDIPFIVYLLKWTMKSRQNAILLSYWPIFFHPPKILTSQYKQSYANLVSQKRGTKISLIFRWQIYVMVKTQILWNYDSLSLIPADWITENDLMPGPYAHDSWIFIKRRGFELILETCLTQTQ